MAKYYIPKMFPANHPDGPTFEMTIDDELTPASIKQRLDLSVVGQEEAKRILSVAGYNAMLRLRNSLLEYPAQIKKTNILLTGGTGCGKTFLIQTLARALHIPVAICDCTALTQTGYVGKDVSSIFTALVENASELVRSTYEDEIITSYNDYTIEVTARAEFGIIYLDEIDKLKTPAVETSRDIGGQSVQEELLRVLEGTTISVSVGMNKVHDFSTENILFIGGGAFGGIEKYIAQRLNTKSIGFGSTPASVINLRKEVLPNIVQADLLSMGMMAELVGRFQNLVVLEDLTVDLLVRILRDSNESILISYINLFDLYGTELVFTDNALITIAKVALSLKLGARSLHTVVEAVLADAQFSVPGGASAPTYIVNTALVTEAVKRRFNICVD